jgi:hypothetical protein
MGGINWLRVLAGGVVAGVVIGTVQAFLIPMLSGSFGAAVEAMGGASPGLAASPAPGFLVAGTAVMFAVGIFTIWLYASIRPRYGPGMGTAAIAGLAVWLAIALAELLLSLLTNLTVAHIATTHGPNIVTFVVAAIAGAWVYREETPARHMPGQPQTARPV